MANRRIILATSNPAKGQQLRWLLEGLRLLPVETAPLAVAEDSPDLAANAAAKALAYSGAGLAIASDGGLEVPALGDAWRPALTRRLGQPRLRELTRGLVDRRACWSEAVAIAEGGRLLASWTETGTHGVLAPEPWPAASDFWVWDIFVFPGPGKTWSELSVAERVEVDRTWMTLKRHVQAFFHANSVE